MPRNAKVHRYVPWLRVAPGSPSPRRFGENGNGPGALQRPFRSWIGTEVPNHRGYIAPQPAHSGDGEYRRVAADANHPHLAAHWPLSGREMAVSAAPFRGNDERAIEGHQGTLSRGALARRGCQPLGWCHESQGREQGSRQCSRQLLTLLTLGL